MPVKEKDQDSKYNPAEKRYGSGGSHDDLGVHPERREAEADDLEKLYNAESAPEKQGSSRQQKKESDKLDSADDPDSGWETMTDNKGRRFKFNRRRAAASGGVFGVLVGGSIGFFGFLAGPLQFIHFAQVLQQFHMSNVLDFSDGRAGKLLRWATTQDAPEDRNLSRTGTKLAKHYEGKLRAKGIDFQYETGRLNSISIDPTSDAGKKLIDGIEADTGASLPRDGDGRVRLDLAGPDLSETSSAKVRRSVIKQSIKAADLEGISGAIAGRMLKIRAAVDFHPLKNIARAADENARLRFEEFKKKVKDQRAESIDKGAQADTTKIDVSPEDPDNPDNPSARSEADAISGVSEEITTEAKDTSKPFSKRVEGVKGKLSAGVGATAIVGLACGLQQVGESVGQIQEANVVQPLIRTGMNAISIGSQVMSGQDVNFDELGVLSESFFDQETKTSWTQADSILAEQGKTGGVPIPDSAKPGKDKPGFFEALDTIISSIPGGQGVCDAVTSTAGGIVLTVAGVAAGFTGPFAAAGSVISDTVQDQIVGLIIPNLVRWLAGEAVDVANFAGADYGNIANYGAFLAANNNMKGMGGRALTTEERVALNYDKHQRIKSDMAAESLYARLLKPSEPNSLFSSTVLASSSFSSLNSSVASSFKYPASIFSSLGSSLRAIIPGASAQTTPFDYGVDEFGFSLGEMNSPDLDNPYENEKLVEPNLDTYNKEYGEVCFGTTIDESGKVTYTAAPTYQDLDANKDKCTSPNALRYRMYLADSITSKALSCYEGLDESDCQEMGFGTQTQETNTKNAKLYLVGDSLTVGMKSAGLDQKLSNKGWQPTTNGLVSRKISGGPAPDGLTQLDQDSAAVRDAGTVVIALGTNHWSESDDVFKGELQKIYDKVKLLNSGASIWWINYYGTGKFSAPLASKTAVLQSFADSTSGRIIDWANEAAPYLPAEDVHPNNYNAMTDVVVNALGSPSVSGGANPGINLYSPALPSSGGSITPKGITLHWWGSSGGNNIESLAGTLRSRGLGVQFGITEDGTIYQMTANETDKASHATGANSTTFGIEIEGGPDDFGANGPQTNPAKFNAVVNLVKYLSAKYNIPTNITGPDGVTCGDVVGVHPHKDYNKCGNTKIDIDDAYFNAVMNAVGGG